jgi:hypothetical protein
MNKTPSKHCFILFSLQREIGFIAVKHFCTWCIQRSGIRSQTNAHACVCVSCTVGLSKWRKYLLKWRGDFKKSFVCLNVAVTYSFLFNYSRRGIADTPINFKRKPITSNSYNIKKNQEGCFKIFARICLILSCALTSHYCLTCLITQKYYK